MGLLNNRTETLFLQVQKIIFMGRISSLLLSILFLGILFTSCSKEYSLEGGGGSGSGTGGGTQTGTAEFTLSGAPGACSTPAISGTYQVGTALNASNIVVLVVDVTTVGTYTITTGTANGISFSGSGTFTVAGSQVLVLTGSGTPAAAGTHNFSPGTHGCTFQITTTLVTVPVAVGTLDCATATPAGVYTQSIALTSGNTVTIPVNVTTAGTYSINTTSTNGVTFSGSGNLASGAQTIVLTGTGTPVNAGAISIPVSLGTSNCSFPITFLPAPPPAAGVLDCAGITIAGVYTQGTALGSSNTISIPVNVTTAGLYSITSSANGVTFSGSGVLASGAQTIVLTGSGTPTNAGPFSFPVNLGASNCSYSITFLVGLPATDYFRVKIDGVLKTFHVNLDGDITPLLLPNSVAISGDNTTGTTEDLDVTIQSATAITAGTYFQPLGLSFCTSRYFDPVSGQGWQAGTASSPPLKVIITSISSTRVTGTFSGQYFDLNGTGTNSKQFTEGEFSVPLP